MNTAKNLETIYERCGERWYKVAETLGISYKYVVELRKGRKPGKFLEEAIARKAKKS